MLDFFMGYMLGTAMASKKEEGTTFTHESYRPVTKILSIISVDTKKIPFSDVGDGCCISNHTRLKVLDHRGQETEHVASFSWVGKDPGSVKISFEGNTVSMNDKDDKTLVSMCI